MLLTRYLATLLANRKLEELRIASTREVISMLQHRQDSTRQSHEPSLNDVSIASTMRVKPPVHHSKTDLMHMFSRKDLIEKMNQIDEPVAADLFLPDVSRIRAESFVSAGSQSDSTSDDACQRQAPQLAEEVSDVVTEQDAALNSTKRVVFAVDIESKADPEQTAEPRDSQDTESIQTTPASSAAEEPWSIAPQTRIDFTLSSRLLRLIAWSIRKMQSATTIYNYNVGEMRASTHGTAVAPKYRRSVVLLHEFVQSLILLVSTKTHWICYLMCIICAVLVCACSVAVRSQSRCRARACCRPCIPCCCSAGAS